MLRRRTRNILLRRTSSVNSRFFPTLCVCIRVPGSVSQEKLPRGGTLVALVIKGRILLLAGLLVGLLVLTVSLTAPAEPIVATYYAEEYVGLPTASGEPYNPYDFTASHPYLPLGTYLLVNYNGRSVVVRVNDRCSCGLDLSLAAAQAIGLTDVGTAVVDAEVL